MQGFALRSQKLTETFLERQKQDDGFQVPDPAVIGKAYGELWTKMMSDPGKLAEKQANLWQAYADLWQQTAKRLAGEDVEPVVEPSADDRRFKDAGWTDETLFDFIKQSYLLTSNWMRSTVQDVDGLDEKTAEKVDFYTRQFVDALSPSNFVATNPKVLRETLETGGENLLGGMENLLGDLEKGKGKLKISMTDTSENHSSIVEQLV